MSPSSTVQITSEQKRRSDFKVSDVRNKTVLYNAMIYPFTRMVIKGVIWYQGRL